MAFDVYAFSKDLGMDAVANKPQYVKMMSEFTCPHGCGFTELSSRFLNFGYWSEACRHHYEEECPLRDVVGV